MSEKETSDSENEFLKDLGIEKDLKAQIQKVKSTAIVSRLLR